MIPVLAAPPSTLALPVPAIADKAIQDEVRNAARTLLEAVQARRGGRLISAGNDLEQPRQK